jgi:toxin ParE1/3/4
VKVEWLLVAARDRENQLTYVGERNPRAAIEIGDAVEAAVRRLLDHPRVGRLGRVHGTRELVVGGTPYLIIYRVESDAVVILRLLHGAQRWPPKP